MHGQTHARKDTEHSLPIPYILFDLARINNIDHIINGDAGLCNVGCQDNLPHPRRGAFKDRLLVHCRHHGVQRDEEVAVWGGEGEGQWERTGTRMGEGMN